MSSFCKKFGFQEKIKEGRLRGFHTSVHKLLTEHKQRWRHKQEFLQLVFCIMESQFLHLMMLLLAQMFIVICYLNAVWCTWTNFCDVLFMNRLLITWTWLFTHCTLHWNNLLDDGSWWIVFFAFKPSCFLTLFKY